MKLKVSKKYIVSINEFMDNFIDMPYTGKDKLTHKEMKRYLYEKDKIIPSTISFKKIKKEDVLRGNCILVRDVTGKIIAYDNPKKIDKIMIETLMNNKDKSSEPEEINKSIKFKVKVKKL